MTRLVFLGTPAPAARVLESLVEAGHEVVLVVTETDKRRGRGTAPSPTPVKALAEKLHIPVSHTVADSTGAGAELGVVVAFGRLVKPDVLENLPMVNVHFSLLPRWRGAAPVERAILAGDEITGVSLMKLDAGLDTGDVYATTLVPIGGGDAADVLERLTTAGIRLLLDALGQGFAGLPAPKPQSGAVSYAAKLTPDELRIDWASPADVIMRKVRVGRAWTTFRGQRFIIWSGRVGGLLPEVPEGGAPGAILGDDVVVTGEGFLVLGEVQAEGRKRQDARSWSLGARVRAGEAFS